MAYKISGTINNNADIIVMNEATSSIEVHESVTAPSYEITVTSGTKIVIARNYNGEAIGYSSVASIYSAPQYNQPTDGSDLIPTMTSNNSPSGLCTASTTYNATYDTYKAFDDNTNTMWYSTSADTQWIQYTFTEAKYVNILRFTSINTGDFNRCPNVFTLQGSNDGNSWDMLLTVNNPTMTWGVGETKEWYFDNSSSYTHFYIHMTDKPGNFGTQAEYGISEIQLGFIDTDVVALDPNRKSANITLSNDNFTARKTVDNLSYNSVLSMSTHSNGKWYFEVVIDETADNSENWFGIITEQAEATFNINSYVGYPNTLDLGVMWYDYYGANYYPGEVDIPSPGRTLVNGDVMSVAADFNNLKVWFAINGQWVNSGNPSNGTNQLLSINAHTYYAALIMRKVNMQMSINLGQNSFQYTVPTGFTGWGL